MYFLLNFIHYYYFCLLIMISIFLLSFVLIGKNAYVGVGRTFAAVVESLVWH